MTHDSSLSPQQLSAPPLTPLPPDEAPGGTVTSAFAVWAWSSEGRATLSLLRPLRPARIALRSLPIELVTACNRDGVVLRPDLTPQELSTVLNAQQTGGTAAAVGTLTMLTEDRFQVRKGREVIEARWRASPHWPALRGILDAHDRGAYAESVAAALAHADCLVKELLSQVGICGPSQLDRYTEALSEHDDFGCALVRTFVNVLLARFGFRSWVPLFGMRAGAQLEACTRASSVRALAWLDLLMLIGDEDARQTVTDLQIIL